MPAAAQLLAGQQRADDGGSSACHAHSLQALPRGAWVCGAAAEGACALRARVQAAAQLLALVQRVNGGNGSARCAHVLQALPRRA